MNVAQYRIEKCSSVRGSNAAFYNKDSIRMLIFSA